MGAGGTSDVRDLVRLGDRVVHRTLAEADPEEWQRLLIRASAMEKAECLCKGGSAPLRMSVAKAGKGLTLKRLPYSGHLHHSRCDSHGLDLRSFQQSVRLPAVQISGGDGLDIKLGVPLATRQTFDGGTAQQELGERAALGVSRSEMSLLGFLHLVWELAGLNRWGAGEPADSRRLGRVYQAIDAVICELSFSGREASSIAYVPTADLRAESQVLKQKELTAQYVALQNKTAEDQKPIMLLMGEAMRVFASKHGYGLSIKGLPLPVWIAPERYRMLSRSWPAAMKSIAAIDGAVTGRSLRAMVVAGVQLSAQGNLNLVYGALMTTTHEFIPVDSGYEAAVASALVAAQRGFQKPLRYTTEEVTHPDFILQDTQPEVVMEVYGMSTPDYLARKAEKTAYYTAEHRRVWEWDAASGATMPAFPPPLK